MAVTTQINNRRYLGNKYRLLPFITRVVEDECEGVASVADVFAGTGAVSSAFQDLRLMTNDILYSNYISNLAWLGPERYDAAKVEAIIDGYNALDASGEENYMTANFADTYFSRDDCAKIGHIREDIERLAEGGEISGRERALLITSLLYAMDRIANTCGHYDAWRRGASFDRHLELRMPQASNANNPDNQCFHEDANALVRRIEADLIYIDPPYNSRQYSDTYHLLENVAEWRKPPVFGVARKMDRTALKSDYCTRKAPEAFADLIANCHCRYILLSYNNMGVKGDDRSNARISDTDIRDALAARGEVREFAEDYKAFSAGKSDIRGNQERLFLCAVRDAR